MNTRITAFMEETMVVIQHFESLGKVITVNADDTIENIFKETCEKL
jgi:adenylate kinase family enzyme